MSRLIRPFNVLKTGFSYILSRIAGRSIISGMPVAVGIEISAYCNLSCPECSYGSGRMTRSKGFMDLELFRKILDELNPYLYNINLYFQGEPMLHPQFFEFLEISRGINATVSTNGHFISAENAKKLAGSGLKRIIISLDATDEETYLLYRQGGNFEKVISGIKHVSEAIKSAGSDLKLEIQFLVNRHNEKQLPGIVMFAKEVGADLRLKSMQIIHDTDIEYWIPEKETFRRYRKSKNSYSLKSGLKNHCLRLWLNPVITWDGKVVPCCFDKDAENIMGDLTVNSFKTIWNGASCKQFRDKVLTNRKMIGICCNCTSGLKGVIY